MSSQSVTLTIQVPKAEIAWLREALRLSRNRYSNPENFITGKALGGAKALAASTVCCKDWKRLQALARRLGVESAI
ncbi:MAG TPA: hypothetical protein VED24_04130 [Candidatus Acidoferrum sp.]|nr:hypothetical protein [Candidatus Acidoferrum sp.]